MGKIEPNFEKRTVSCNMQDGAKRANVIVVIIQDFSTKEILMQGFMDSEAWDKTLSSGFVHFRSLSREELWLKGATSGNKMEVRAVYLDCDVDSALILVEVQGAGVVCHTGNRTCFFNRVE